ncbi:MAG: 50S ribosomal protein L29 [Candidatus Diapherotrites archaeon]|uniref:Large ribosomal subunit protein uL29 n=1 Tax=Candidatus Iainarchaeum sp. TaxID=3101447 RepID=A0A2D6LPL4_9ARCH|nr:50S ribosomal protein L29 [Candidatus Diapherotrites archaeon]
MGKKRLATLRDNSVEELEGKLVDLKNVLSKEKAMVASGTRAEKPSKIKNTRRQIARILTIVAEKNAGVTK